MNTTGTALRNLETVDPLQHEQQSTPAPHSHEQSLTASASDIDVDVHEGAD